MQAEAVAHCSVRTRVTKFVIRLFEPEHVIKITISRSSGCKLRCGTCSSRGCIPRYLGLSWRPFGSRLHVCCVVGTVLGFRTCKVMHMLQVRWCDLFCGFSFSQAAQSKQNSSYNEWAHGGKRAHARSGQERRRHAHHTSLCIHNTRATACTAHKPVHAPFGSSSHHYHRIIITESSSSNHHHRIIITLWRCP